MFHANIIGRFAARISNVPLVCSGVRVAERDSPLRLAIDRLTGSLVDAWVAVGESTAEFTRKVGRIPSERVFSIPNGAQIRKIGDELRIVASGDLTSNAQARESFATRSGANRKKLVAVGRLTRQKGFDLLLESAATWLDSERAKEWELWIVGDGEESDALREQRDRLGLKDSVFLLGWRADVARILADSEIFLLSSRWEGMPNALLEAAALGKPALCSNVEGVSEILGENAEPQTYVLGDLEEEVKKINALLDDEALRRDLGQKNRERVLKEFTVEKTAERYEELWLKLLRKKGVTFKFDNEAAECESDPKKR